MDNMDELTLLTSVRNETEANIIESILKPHGIPTSIQHKGSGSYMNIYMGMSIFGIDIFVPEAFLKQAQDLIRENKLELHSFETKENKAAQADNYKEKYNQRRRNRILILTFVFMVPTVISILYNLIKNIIN